MLFTEMDLLNQYFDKMNNNIGMLCYEGKIKPIYCFLTLGSWNEVFGSENNGRPWRHRVSLGCRERARCFSLSRDFYDIHIYF